MVKGSGRKRRCVNVKYELKYIPILKTLERLLHSKSLLEQVSALSDSLQVVRINYDIC